MEGNSIDKLIATLVATKEEGNKHYANKQFDLAKKKYSSIIQQVKYILPDQEVNVNILSRTSQMVSPSRKNKPYSAYSPLPYPTYPPYTLWKRTTQSHSKDLIMASNCSLTTYKCSSKKAKPLLP